MNILIFNWRDTRHSWAGGSEIYIHELAKRWAAERNTVTLFCGQDLDRKLPEEEYVDGVRVVRRGGRYSVYLWAVVYYYKKLRKNVDVIIDVENGIPFFTPFFSRKKKVCLVYHVHGRQFFVEMPFPLSLVGYFIEKYLFVLFYGNLRIMAISESTKKELIKLGFRKKNISIVVPGVEMNDANLSSIDKYRKPTILYLGRIKKYKRIDLLIKVFSQIEKSNQKARLIIAGWGSEAPFISDLVMKSSQRRKIKLLGPVSEFEKKKLLAKSWVFVNPSIHEGWGISVIETNLLKTPAVSFKVPGLSDSINDGVTGFLSDTESDLVENINKLLSNTSLRERMSRNARKWALQFTWSNSAKKGYKILRAL